MAALEVNGVKLAYDDVGPREGADCAVLIHGFTSNRNEGWRRMGWLGAFERRRMRAIAFDIRGHGESDKPHDPAAYSSTVLVEDILELTDTLGVRTPILMGYSMGARLALTAAMEHPEHFTSLVLGGVGGQIFAESPAGNPMADAMEANAIEAVSDPLLRSFRQFAEKQGEDLQALAACARAQKKVVTPRALTQLRVPTLVVAGTKDTLAGSPEELARHIPGARAVSLPGCDHFSAIAHALFKAAVFDFIEETIV